MQWTLRRPLGSSSKPGPADLIFCLQELSSWGIRVRELHSFKGEKYIKFRLQRPQRPLSAPLGAGRAFPFWKQLFQGLIKVSF